MMALSLDFSNVLSPIAAGHVTSSSSSGIMYLVSQSISDAAARPV